MGTVCAFTGYRREKMPFVENNEDAKYTSFRVMLTKVIARLIERGVDTYITGCATGFDMWAGEEICKLKKENPALKLICAIPFDGQANSWSTEDQRRRYKLITQADESVIVSDHYSSGVFHERNRFMVDKADVVVAAFDGKPGGTAYTVEYAIKHDRIVIGINPSTAEVTMLSKRNFNS